MKIILNLVIILITLCESVVAQKEDMVLSKVTRLNSGVTYAPGFNFLYLGSYYIDPSSLSNDSVKFIFTNLNMIPIVAEKRKDGLKLITKRQDQACHTPNIKTYSTLKRKEICLQLISQLEDDLFTKVSYRYDEIYRNAFKSASKILDGPYDDQFFSKETSVGGLYRDFKQHFKKRFKPLLEIKAAEIHHRKLKREYKLALRSFKNEKKWFSKRIKVFRKYLKSGGGNIRPYHNKLWELNFGSFTGEKEDIRFQAFRKNGSYAEISFDTIYTEKSPGFPQIDSANCYPVNRILYYRQLPGYNYKPESFRNKYKPKSEKVRYRDFTLYFGHNKSEYDLSDVKPILEFLADSNYVIEKARVHAFASIEGDSANNHRLQKERAQVLINLLQQEQKEDSIELVEIYTAENWEMFFEQIEKTPWEDWKDSTKAEIKLLVEDDSVAELIEPILAPERKAILKLMVIEKLTPERREEITFRNYKKALSRLIYSRHRNIREKAFIWSMRIRSYIREQLRSGEFDSATYCTLFAFGTPALEIMEFYEMKEALKRNNKIVCQPVEDIVMSAHYASIRLLESVDKDSKIFNTRLRQAIEIQLFIMDGLVNKTLPEYFYRHLNYPRDPRFHYLLLNKLYFRKHEGRELAKKYEAKEKGPVVKGPVKNLYYYILKEIILNDQFNMIKRSPNYFEFELYEFLAFYAVGPWDPEKGEFFDEDVNEQVMAEQLSRLQRISKILCRKQLNQLILDYHTKAAYFHFVKDGRLNQKTINSLLEIKKHYQNRKDKLDGDLAAMVAKHLMWYSRSTNGKGLWRDALDVLERNYDRNLRTKESTNYFFLLKSFDTRRIERRLIEAIELLEPLEWCALFKGKYNLDPVDIQDPELFKMVCNKCFSQKDMVFDGNNTRH